MPSPLTSECLLAIRAQLEETNTLPLLPTAAWKTVKELGLNVRRTVVRGTRGGKNLQRRIPVRVSSHRRTVSHTTSGPNFASLITVPQAKYSNNKLKVCSLNAQSVRNKAHSLCDYIYYNDLDICAITETWLKADDQVVVGDLVPSGYTIKSIPRHKQEGWRCSYHP